MNDKNRRVGECMRKLNNKGFAATTLLYGTLILIFLSVFSIMAYMSANRSNTKKLTNTIKEELTGIGRKRANFRLPSTDDRTADEKKRSYHSTGIPYYVSSEGYYFIQLFGAQGGSIGTKSGGKGAYTSGIIYLKVGTTLYFHIGGKGEVSNENGVLNCSTGIGGGGEFTTCSNSASPGGGATYVSYDSTTGSDNVSKDNVIMVAAGGGGATRGYPGGDGGNLKGKNGNKSSGGEQKKSSTFDNFLTGGASDGTSGSGGSGYYGGEAGSSANDSGAGGSSYISGYAGTEGDNIEKELSFINGAMIPGVKTDGGMATIAKIDNFQPTSPLTLTSITACADSDKTIKTLKLTASSGKSESLSLTPSSTSASGNNTCNTYTISSSNTSEIDLWYDKVPNSIKLTYNTNKELSANEYNIKKDETDGIRYSLLDKMIEGNYYLISSTSKFYNKNTSNTQKFENFSAQANHKIKITPKNNYFSIAGTTYKIKTTTGNSYYIEDNTGKKLDTSTGNFVTLTDEEVDKNQKYQLKLVRVYG